MSLQVHHADVAVIGAGSAGVAAALSAAQAGANVVLVEKNDYPGGKATAAMVGTVCGLYLSQPTDEAKWSAGGLMKEFALRLATESTSKPMRFYDRLHFLPYNIAAFKKVCSDLIAQNPIDTYWGAEIVQVDVVTAQVRSAIVKHAGTTFQLNADQWIDCTGEAHFTRLASPDWVSGGDNQAAARVFRLDGIAEMPADAIHFALSRALRRGVHDQLISEHLAKLSVVPGSFKNGSAYFKLPLPQVVSNDAQERDELLSSSEKDVRALVDFLKVNAPSFSGCTLGELAPEVGFRTGYRAVGREHLTEDQVIRCLKSPEGIANGAWPIEYWKPGEQAEMEFFEDGDYYQIPAGCLESEFAKNLYFAGRNISATPRAMASARVMGTCLQTGFAAGALAAHASKGISRDESIAHIRTASELEL